MTKKNGSVKVFAVSTLLCGMFLAQGCQAMFWNKLAFKTRKLNKKLRAYQSPLSYCDCEGNMKLPEATVLADSLCKRGGVFPHMITGTWVRDYLENWSANKRMNRERGGEGTASHILACYRRDLKSDLERYAFFGSEEAVKTHHKLLVDFFKNRRWDRDAVNEEIKAYLAYAAKNPKEILKKKLTFSKTYVWKSVPSDHKEIKNFEDSLINCVEKHGNSVEDCEKSHRYLAGKLIYDEDSRFSKFVENFKKQEV